MRCVLLAKKWPRFGSNFKKMAKKISNGESDGERKIYPSANPAYKYIGFKGLVILTHNLKEVRKYIN